MATAFKLIQQTPSDAPAWFSPKLEELAANIEIKRESLSAQYQRREMPRHIEDRWGKLDEAWGLLCAADECLRSAEYDA